MAQPRVSSLRRIQPALARLKKRLPFKSRYCLGRYAGIPILAHWSILAMLPLFYLLSDRPGEGRSLWYALLAGACFAALMCLHEIGHAFVARKRGIFVSGIFIYPFHGRCLHEMPEYELDDVLIAWGGVAAQAIVLLAALALGPALDYVPYEVRSQLNPLFAVFISMNIATILLNLLPIAPLDGHLAWRIIPLLLARMCRREWRLRMPKKKTRLSLVESDKLARDAIKKIMDRK